MAEGGKNPDEPPPGILGEMDHGDTEKQRQSPDILMNVIGPSNSTIETSNVVGLASGGVGTTSAGAGNTTEEGHIPDEPPLNRLRNKGQTKTMEDRWIGNINVIANGPKDSTVTTANVIGFADSVTVQNYGKGEITMKYHNGYQKQLLDSTEEKISIRTRGMIRVSAVDKMIEKLQHGNNWITITGNAGDGKTTLGHFILKHFADTMSVYVIEAPDEYRQISKIEEDRVILLNDIFGAFTFDTSSVSKWRDVVADIFDIQMKRSKSVTKVLFVSRHNILQEVKVHLEKYGEKLTDNENWFDLSQMNSENERLQILKYHLDRKGIRKDNWVIKRVANMNTIHGFPHCCEMCVELVSKEQDISMIRFFKTPLKFLDKTTKLLFETGYRKLFINLVKSDGKFSTDSVEDEENRWTLEEQAKRQEGSYLSNFDGIWVFRHPSIYESVLSVVADKDPLLLVNNASISVIMQKVRFRTSRSETPTCFILLDPRPRVFDALAERFLERLKERDYYIFRLIIGRNEDFICRLINKLSSLDRNASDLINRQGRMGYTMLHHALQYYNYPAVRALLAHGADPNICDSIGTTCLRIVCHEPFGRKSSVNIDILSLLITHKCIVNDIDGEGKTPLHYLCEHEEVSVEALQLLLNSGADVNHIDSKRKTPLHYLCDHEEVSVEALQLLFNSGADINHIDSKRKTPLHYLCDNEEVSVEALQLLLNRGADVNHIDKREKTPLHYLCKRSEVSVEALQLLLNSEANVNHIDSDGMTPLHYLCTSKEVSVEALQLLLNSGADINHVDSEGKTPLDYLCGRRGVSVEALQLLLNSGADINHGDSKRKTPLHYLCDHEEVSVEALQLLLNSGADINHIDSKRKTPLHYLCDHEEVSVEALQLLLNSGSDVNHIDSNGKTPLHCLCEHKEVSVEALQLLLNSGSDVNHIDSNGKTPLHYLYDHKEVSVEALQLLLNSGADINQRDESGFTPLHALCQNPNISVESVRLLIRKGAGVINVDKQGRTPLHELCTGHKRLFVYSCMDTDPCPERASEYQAVMDTLIRNGSDVNKSDDAGNTPLHSLCDIPDIPDIPGKFDLYSAMHHRTYLLGALKALIKAGADVNVQNQKRKTPDLMLNFPDFTEAIKLLTTLKLNVIGPQNSTIETSNVVGAALDGARVGTTSAGPGRTTDKGHTPDEPPLKKLRTLGCNETMKDSLPRNISVTANGPNNSTVTNSSVIGYAESVTVQNDGKGEITMKCQHDYQRKLLNSTKEKILIRTRGMIRVSAVDSMIEKLKHGNTWITITGNAGDGKTTLAHFVLKDFADNMNVYVIKTPEEYDHISQIVEDRVILLNDIFGDFNFDASSVNKWRDVVADIFDIQMNRPKGVTKVVFVSRHNILQEVKVHLEKYGENITDNENGFDLSQMNTENERLQILKYHLERKSITKDNWVLKRVAGMHTLHGFPHCCEMYVELVSKEQDIDIVDFFETPLKFLDKTTKLLFETGYRELFINLVKRDGEFSTDSVEDDEKKWNLEEQATRQEGSYLANFDGIWVFRHPSIYESVLSVVAQKDPLLLVKHASMSVIKQKVRFRTSRSETPTCFILLDPRTLVLDALAERFLEQLKEEDYSIFKKGDVCIFELTIGRNEEFIERFINKLSSLEQSFSDLINKQDWIGNTMLLYAVENSNYPAVRALMAHDADPYICDWSGRTCLTVVCGRGFERQSSVNMDILRLLITHRANVCHYDSEGKTPLHYLCEHKEVSVEALQLLLNSGADVNNIDSDGKTPLKYLCDHEDVSVEALQLLLKSGADVNDIDYEGKTPLHYLCDHEDVSVEALQLLLNSGADVNHIDYEGKTPLHYLCDHEDVSVEALQLLLNSGADINHIDSEGKTPLHYLRDHEDVSVEALQLLLNSGADINHIDSEGKTPLHYLCKSRKVSVEALQLLLNSGADINHIDSDGLTPLHYLCGHQEVSVEALQFLFNSEANVNLCDESGFTPLHALCKNSNISVETVQLLIRMGAGVNRVDKHGRTPLHVFCSSHRLFGYFFFDTNSCLEKVSAYQAVMDTLIRNGSDVNKSDGAGNTPLHSLCDITDIFTHLHNSGMHIRRYLPGALKALLKGGADVKLKNKKGETPVQMLRQNYPWFTESIKLITE